jgi:hypothetical protein
MTEEQWLTTRDDLAMLEQIQADVSLRKLRLLYCGAARHRWDLVRPKRWKDAVALGEQLAERDDENAREQMKSTLYSYIIRRKRREKLKRYGLNLDCWPPSDANAIHSLLLGSMFSDRMLRQSHRISAWTTGRIVVSEVAASFLRCIFGNPFSPVVFVESWRTETAVALAAGIYEERAFDRLPILADALEDAGCDHADVLTHCRVPSPHVRGCWVVDGVLGKS